MALREINLSDPRRQARRKLQRYLALWAGALFISQAVIGSVYVYQAKFVLPRKRALMQINQVQSSLRTRIQAISEAREELERLKSRHALITSLAGRHTSASILARLVDNMAASTWLTKLELNSGKPEAPPRMKIIGYTSSHTTLGDFIDRLVRDDLFESVVLKYAGTGRTPSGRFNSQQAAPVQFEIECGIYKG